MTYWEKLREYCADKEHIKFTTHKYRCEQTIITKLNSIPTCTIKMNADYCVEQIENVNTPVMNVYCKLLEQFVSVYPTNYEHAFEMISDLEKIKLESIIDVDMSNGKMKGIVNRDEIIHKWNDYKDSFLSKYDFLRSAATKESIVQFIESVEKVMTNEKLLLMELSSKLFFMFLFGGYLVGYEEYQEPYEEIFYSQLFKQISFPMTIKPIIRKESPEFVWIERKGEISDKVRRSEDIERMYNEQFKPTINYSFSKYDALLNVKALINEKERTLKQAEAYILEEIQHNVSLVVQCSVRELEDNRNEE